MRQRIGAGVALSLAVHLLLVSSWRGWRAPAALPEAPHPLAVRVQPPPAPPPPRVDTPSPAPPATAEAPVPADAPRFDLDAARKAARSLAHVRDPAREGRAVAQFPEPPLETETRAARAIGAAKRRSCKDGVPGGLLAPLLMLADKKDSGCKW